MRTIRGKKALVTGAASGIGRAVTLALAREGADLYLLDVDEPGLVRVASEARRHGGLVVAAYCDVACPKQISAQIKAVLKTWGALDILVNNAGVVYYGPTECMTAEQWGRLLGINLLAPIQFTRELLPVLLAQPEAHIVNVSSMFGLTAFGKLAAYHTSKYGLVGFSESLRAEFAHRGLGVTALCPGFVQTNLFEAAVSGGAKAVRTPPAWICTSPEAVAARAIQAILKNRGLVVFTAAARVLWFVKRLSPRLFEWLNRLGRRKRKADPNEAGFSRSATAEQAVKDSLPRAA
jgi:NAD(P)-dependent dehydrogenase (short-subunit alcohol dehydrogenase family)